MASSPDKHSAGERQSQPRRPGRLPAEIQHALQRARRLEWLVMALRLSVVIVLLTVLGASTALHAIWLKSLWSLWPPAAFLVACRIERNAPTPRFPYGFYRAVSISFLSAALALSCMGLYLLYSGLVALIAAKDPSLTPIDADHIAQWRGWWIIAALAYSTAIPSVLARLRRGLAVRIHDKSLYADATMGQMSWLAGGAAIIGVLGIGLGIWWADFLATCLIGIDVLWHGLRHLYTAICDLIDEVPREIGSNRLDPLGQDIRDHLLAQAWVCQARVRLREEGRLLTGVALIRTTQHKASVADLLDQMDKARQHIESMDWRLLDFQLVPIGEQDSEDKTAHDPQTNRNTLSSS